MANQAAETAAFFRLELQSVTAAALPAFDAGAHVAMHLPGGFVRRYSLCTLQAKRNATRSQSSLTRTGAARIEIPVSCEQGVCGTRVTPVLRGTPDHRDRLPTNSERAGNTLFTPRCSISEGALTRYATMPSDGSSTHRSPVRAK